MNNLAQIDSSNPTSIIISAYDDGNLDATKLSTQQRDENVELVIQRFFIKDNTTHGYVREALMRSINPGSNYIEQLSELEELAEGGFGPELQPPSTMVAAAFRTYAQTELGAVALARLIEWDNRFIEIGWRAINGSLTEDGIVAFGQGQWRPFRVACNGTGSDAVTPSGLLLVPEFFHEEFYSTGDVSNPLAILHHEIKAHVLPLKEAEGLVPGREMELICVRLESEMLRELGLPERQLNWGKDDGTLDHTLHEQSEQYYRGLVRYSEDGALVEINPETDCVIGPARVKARKS